MAETAPKTLYPKTFIALFSKAIFPLFSVSLRFREPKKPFQFSFFSKIVSIAPFSFPRILVRFRIGLISFQCRCGSSFQRRPCVGNAVAGAAKLFLTESIFLDITECASLSSSESLVRFLGSFHKFEVGFAGQLWHFLKAIFT